MLGTNLASLYRLICWKNNLYGALKADARSGFYAQVEGLVAYSGEVQKSAAALVKGNKPTIKGSE